MSIARSPPSQRRWIRFYSIVEYRTVLPPCDEPFFTDLHQLCKDVFGNNHRDELAQRGHTITAKDGPIGTPVMLLADQGTYYAAGDPAARRHAAGLERD